MDTSSPSSTPSKKRFALYFSGFITALAIVQFLLQLTLRKHIFYRKGSAVPFPPRFEGEPWEQRRRGGPYLVPEHLDDGVNIAIMATSIIVIVAQLAGWIFWSKLHPMGGKVIGDAKARAYRLTLCVIGATVLPAALAMTLYAWIRESLNPTWKFDRTDPWASTQTFTLESWVCQVSQDIPGHGLSNDCRIALTGRALTVPLFLSVLAMCAVGAMRLRQDLKAKPDFAGAKEADGISLEDRLG